MVEVSGHKLRAILFCMDMAMTTGFKAYQHPDFKPEYIDLRDLHMELNQHCS